MSPSSSLKPNCAYKDCVSSEIVLSVLNPGLYVSWPSGTDDSDQFPYGGWLKAHSASVLALPFHPAVGAPAGVKSSNAAVRLKGVSSAPRSGPWPLSPTPQSPSAM